MPDQYDHFRARLLGEKIEIQENKPQAGAYRRKDKNRRWEAVMLWQDGGVWKALVHPNGGAPYNVLESKHGFDAICRLWSDCCRNIVAFGIYHDVTQKGLPWPDEIEQSDRSNSAAISDLDRIMSEVDDLIRDAAKIKDEALLDGFDAAAYAARLAAKGDPSDLVPNLARLSNIATKIVELKNEAEKIRKAEKEPHLQAGREVDEKWRPPVTKADNAGKELKARAGRALAEIKARLQALNPPNHDGPAGDAGEVKVAVGTRGKKVALKTIREVVFDDYEAALNHALTNPAFRKMDMLQRLVRGAAEYELFHGREFPGARFETREVAA